MKFRNKSLNISTLITVWFIVVITLLSEVSSPFKDFLTGVTGHHWVTKGVFSLVLFVLLYLLLVKIVKESDDGVSWIYYTIASVIVGGLIIFGFFVWHFFA